MLDRGAIIRIFSIVGLRRPEYVIKLGHFLEDNSYQISNKDKKLSEFLALFILKRTF